MSSFLLKFEKDGDEPASGQAIIESDGVKLATAIADQIADAGGGGNSILQLFDNKGLVATRSARGLWSV